MGEQSLKDEVGSQICSESCEVTFSLGFIGYIGPRPIVGEGDGTPLQHSCLENPMDGGA